MPDQPVTRIAYSPTEAAQVLGITRASIYNMINRGELRRYKVGRLTRINAAEVHALVGADVEPPAA